MHIECLVQGPLNATVRIEVRFLHLQVCRVSNPPTPAVISHSEDAVIESWNEAVERSVEVRIALGAPYSSEFGFPGSGSAESLPADDEQMVGRIVRSQHEIRGNVSVLCAQVNAELWKLMIDVANNSPLALTADRNAALLPSLLSAQALLRLSGGQFVSLLDPPEDVRREARGCVNIGNFPVLVGENGDRETMLCSPILLYDYPNVAPESAGDFYDATEIDEMLTLRVLTLTDEEKRQLRSAEHRVQNLLQRTQQSAQEQLARTHAIMHRLDQGSK
jgi:hydrogenase maturation protease